jgi:hypothetical protein
MEQLLIAAQRLDSPPLVAYLNGRQRAIETEWQRLEPEFEALQRLAAALR